MGMPDSLLLQIAFCDASWHMNKHEQNVRHLASLGSPAT